MLCPNKELKCLAKSYMHKWKKDPYQWVTPGAILPPKGQWVMSGDILECHKWEAWVPTSQHPTITGRPPQQRMIRPRTSAVPRWKSLADTISCTYDRLHRRLHHRPHHQPQCFHWKVGSLLRINRQPVSLDDESGKMLPCFLRTDSKFEGGNFQMNKREDNLFNYIKPVTVSLT